MANQGREVLRMRHMTVEERDEYLRQLIDEVSDESDIDQPVNDVAESDDDTNVVAANLDASDAEQESYPPEINLESESDDEEFENEDVDHVPATLDQPFLSRDGTKWRREIHTSRRSLSHNVMKQRGGPHRSTINLTLLQTFKCFFTTEICDIIIRETNRKAQRSYETWNTNNPGSIKVWKPVTVEEFDAFLGILITAGVSRSNYEHTTDLWKTFSNPLYRASMGLRRFWSITQFIRFDNENTRSTRLEKDKAAPIRDLFVMLNANLRKYFTPYDAVTIDEQLYPYRGRTKFTQYIPSKPAKYGIKVWWICDAKTAYPLQADLYTGKLPNESREVNQGERVVTQLIEPYRNSGRTLTIDNFFTSLPLAQRLMRWNLAVVGTLRKNKPYIPTEFQASRQRDVLTTEFGFYENVTMCSYVPKKNKAVILLSTLHYDKNVSGVKNKPDIINYYNLTKGAVDTMDKMLSEYTTKRRTKRWPVAFFYNMLDVAALATHIIYSINNPELSKSTFSRRKNLQELGRALAMPSIEKRAATPFIYRNFNTRNGLEAMLMRKIGGTSESFQSPSTSGSSQPFPSEERDKSGRLKHKGNCFICRKDDKRRPVRKACHYCLKPVCAEHSNDFIKCQNCP